MNNTFSFFGILRPATRLQRVTIGLLLLILPNLMEAQTITQNLQLQPGWNAVFLHLEPENTDPSVIFGGTGVSAVWTYSTRLTSVEFIENPDEPLWNRSAWRVYVPAGNPGAFQTSLFRIFGNRSYLIHLGGDVTESVTISGRPSFRPLEWVPDAFNLRGFPVDPANAPTFREFFRAGPAHYDAAQQRLEPIYRLNPEGNWVQVHPSDFLEAGVAYWAYCRGGSDYQAPMELRIDFGDGLDFGASLSEQNFTLINREQTTRLVQLELTSSGVAPLSYRNPEISADERWLQLPSVRVISVGPGASRSERWALRRQDMAESSHADVVEVSDGQGTLWRFPLVATRKAMESGPVETLSLREAKSRAGLWVGNVLLDAVAEVNAGPLFTNELKQVVRVSTATSVEVLHDFNLGLSHDSELYGSATVQGGFLRLTPGEPGVMGAFRTSVIAPGRSAGGFTASFRLRLDSTGSATPADGFSFNFGSDIGAGGYGEWGAGSGLRISFDTFNNQADDRGIKVYWGETLIARDPAPDFPPNGTEFVQVKIRLYPDGRLDLEYGGRQVFAGQQIPGHQPQSNVRFGFGARTGGFFSAHDIDDLQLQVFLESLHEVTTPARNELSMRLLIHVDSNGKARLLREVIQMWQNGTYATDGEGRQVVATPGRFVLITDDALIGRYSGASLRDGQPVGRRLSTASYDWGDDRPHVEMTSEFATGNTLVSLLELGAKAPTNPFRHKFHPDHDNLDATFRNYREEAYPITRRVEVTLTETDPSGPAAPDHGYGAVAGTYRETITGLHKAPLVASGRFRLVRVSEAEELNP